MPTQSWPAPNEVLDQSGPADTFQENYFAKSALYAIRQGLHQEDTVLNSSFIVPHSSAPQDHIKTKPEEPIHHIYQSQTPWNAHSQPTYQTWHDSRIEVPSASPSISGSSSMSASSLSSPVTPRQSIQFVLPPQQQLPPAELPCAEMGPTSIVSSKSELSPYSPAAFLNLNLTKSTFISASSGDANGGGSSNWGHAAGSNGDGMGMNGGSGDYGNPLGDNSLSGGGDGLGGGDGNPGGDDPNGNGGGAPPPGGPGENGDQPPQAPKTKKLVLACHFCRRRKLKCDGQKPICENCAKRGEQCTWDDLVRRRGPGKRTKEQREKSLRDTQAAGLDLSGLKPEDLQATADALAQVEGGLASVGDYHDTSSLGDLSGVDLSSIGGVGGEAGPSTLAEMDEGGPKRKKARKDPPSSTGSGTGSGIGVGVGVGSGIGVGLGSLGAYDQHHHLQQQHHGIGVGSGSLHHLHQTHQQHHHSVGDMDEAPDASFDGTLEGLEALGGLEGLQALQGLEASLEEHSKQHGGEGDDDPTIDPALKDF